MRWAFFLEFTSFKRTKQKVLLGVKWCFMVFRDALYFFKPILKLLL